MTFDLQYAMTLLPGLLSGAVVTVQVTLVGMTIALAGGVILVLLRLSRNPLVRYPLNFFIEFVRSTPVVIQLFVVFYVLPRYGFSISPFIAGAVTLGIHYSCYTSEVYRAGIASVPKGQWEAARALNLSRGRTWRRVILPQAVPPVVPMLGNYFIAMFKETPVLFTISVGELLFVALNEAYQTYRYLEPITLVGIIFLGLSLVASASVRLTERIIRIG